MNCHNKDVVHIDYVTRELTLIGQKLVRKKFCHYIEFQRSMIKMVIVITIVRHSVCAPLRPCNSKTNTSMELKFAGQILLWVHQDSSKYGEI